MPKINKIIDGCEKIGEVAIEKTGSLSYSILNLVSETLFFIIWSAVFKGIKIWKKK